MVKLVYALALVSISAVAAVALATECDPSCSKVTIGGAGADAIFVSPRDSNAIERAQTARSFINETRTADSVRVSITIDPVRFNTRSVSEVIVLPMEFQ